MAVVGPVIFCPWVISSQGCKYDDGCRYSHECSALTGEERYEAVKLDQRQQHSSRRREARSRQQALRLMGEHVAPWGDQEKGKSWGDRRRASKAQQDLGADEKNFTESRENAPHMSGESSPSGGQSSEFGPCFSDVMPESAEQFEAQTFTSDSGPMYESMGMGMVVRNTFLNFVIPMAQTSSRRNLSVFDVPIEGTASQECELACKSTPTLGPIVAGQMQAQARQEDGMCILGCFRSVQHSRAEARLEDPPVLFLEGGVKRYRQDASGFYACKVIGAMHGR
ncbi:unnamed protein product [Polarella glacialis]|uniref:C3H1-type domain-containing protein n=1 Tax=Polarella glacialis TaxID=89957 RepID=A0A813DNG9_POLGL|nr:unnamed protein product [Polarella glacialis]